MCCMPLSQRRPRRPCGRVTPLVPCSAPVGPCLGHLRWSQAISSSVVVLPAAAVSPAPVSFPRIPFPRRARRGAASGLPLLPPVMFRLNSLEDTLVHLSGCLGCLLSSAPIPNFKQIRFLFVFPISLLHYSIYTSYTITGTVRTWVTLALVSSDTSLLLVIFLILLFLPSESQSPLDFLVT